MASLREHDRQVAIDSILINAAPGETRIALVEGRRLCELVVARADMGSVVGNVYLGRVARVLPGIQAAFLDIGLERAGFLALAEARPPGPREAHPPGPDSISDYLGEGDSVVVQVQRDPGDDKGARLTTRPTLPGRYVVYAPGLGGIKVSRRIADEDQRARLENWLRALIEGSEGVIARTAAAAADRQALADDLDALRDTWAKITAERDAGRPPACLHRDLEPLHQVLRDEAGPGLRSILVDQARTHAEVVEACRRLAPELADRVELDGGPEPLFEAHGIDEQIEEALAPAVELPSGGNIVIEETTALTAIDVNTAGASERGRPEDTALATNLEAAAEIARQLRLRNLSGLVVADFVAMKQNHNTGKVLDALRRAVSGDPCSTHVIGFTRLGLVEMTRRKRRQSLSRTLGVGCPTCAGAGRVKSPLGAALEALRAVLREAAAGPGTALAVRADPALIEALGGAARQALAETEERLARPLELTADGSLAGGRFEVTAAARGRDGDG